MSSSYTYAVQNDLNIWILIYIYNNRVDDVNVLSHNVPKQYPF